MKYARYELERRYLVTTHPDLSTFESAEIVDRYLIGTSLRIRTVVKADDIVFKFTKKESTDNPAQTIITNTYLTEYEKGLFEAIPNQKLQKRRYQVAPNIVVDVFGGGLKGLVLAETDGVESTEAPTGFIWRDVTDYRRYKGDALANGLSREYFRMS